MHAFAWHDHAACRGDGGDWIEVPGSVGRWTEPTVRDEVERMKRICFACPVRAECRSHGEAHETAGMWGGLLPSERRARR